MSSRNDDGTGKMTQDEGRRGRFDLIIEEVRSQDGEIEISVRFDPRRYDEIEKDGELFYVDRFTRTIFSSRLLEGIAEKLPLYDVKPRIQSTSEYAEERAVAIQNELAGFSLIEPSTAPALQKDFFPSAIKTSTPFLSLDICRSTQMRRHEGAAFDKASEILLRELQILVGQFEATILKSTGDGFIAYLPHPAFTRQCDLIVDLGTSMIRLSKEAVCPALSLAGLPALDIRVGADYGEAMFRKKTNLVTGFSWDHVDSDALNLAVKIEQTAAPNTMRIGRALYEILHVQWLQRTRQVASEKLPPVLVNYPVYEVD